MVPRLNKNGKRNKGYTTMTYVERYDFILHHSNNEIVSISVAISNCYDAKKPHELSEINNNWNKDGYRIDVKYYDFDKPLILSEHKSWLKANYTKNSAFTIGGTGKQQYMCTLDDNHARYLLNKIIELQVTNNTISKLKEALSSLVH